MRNKFKLLYVALLAVVIGSCSDAYEITQDAGTDDLDKLYSNVPALERGVTALYYNIPAETEIGFTSIFTDETAIGRSNGGQGITDGSASFNLNSGSAEAEAIWGSYYALVRSCNELLEAGDKLIESTPSTEAEVNALKGEMLVLRAFANLKLFMYFTPDYTNPSGLSVMKLDVVPPKDLSLELPRESVSTIVDFIEKDLQDAESLFSASELPRYRVNKFIIHAIRAKLGTCINDPAMVQQAYSALEVAGGLSVANDIQFKHLFNQMPEWTGTEEAIYTADPYDYSPAINELLFYIRRKVANSGAVAANWYSVRVMNSGSPFFEMGRSLYNEFDALDPDNQGATLSPRGDVRYEVNLIFHPALGTSEAHGGKVATNYQDLSLADYVSKDILLISKYKGKSDNILQNDIPIFRMTDMLLSLAEARAMEGVFMSSSSDPEALYTNPTESVQSILFYLRVNRRTDGTLEEKAAAVTPMTISSAQEAYAAILAERRVEFAFEGHRYLDMKRLGVKAGSQGFVRDDMDVRLGSAKSLEPSSYKLTLPIPESEIRSNSLMVPNPEY